MTITPQEIDALRQEFLKYMTSNHLIPRYFDSPAHAKYCDTCFEKVLPRLGRGHSAALMEPSGPYKQGVIALESFIQGYLTAKEMQIENI